MVVTDDVKIARRRQTELIKQNNNCLNMKNSYTSIEEIRLQAKKYLEKIAVDTIAAQCVQRQK
jgi:hypothetical protein